MSKVPYWIKERHNPQLGTYYVPYGQMSRSMARKVEDALYEAEYTAKLEALRKAGERVRP